MVHHTPSQARARSMAVFIHPCWPILGVLCCQCGCGPFAWLIIQWCINPIHEHIDEPRVVSTTIWMVEANGTSHNTQGKKMKVPQFVSILPYTILGLLCGQYWCDILAWLLVQWCINPTHASIDEPRVVSTYVCGWLELMVMVHHTQSKARAGNVPGFIHPSMVHPWSVVWPVWM